MKLNWFSPLFPAKTDIAHYTLRLLPALSQQCEVELWTTNDNYDPKINELARVNVYDLSAINWPQINQADINIYNIGNNQEFHQAIWKVSQHCPGIVVLHDLRLQGLFGGIYKSENDLDSYLKQMLYHYGPDGRKIGELFWKGEISGDFVVEQFPLTPLAIRNAKGVISHSHYAYQTLKEQNLSSTGYIPLPYSEIKKSPNVVERLNNHPYQLIIFGFISTNRRLETILEALASFSNKSCFKLDIYGEIWDTSYIQQKIQNLGLTDLVTIKGFVPENELDKALSQADISFNLRYPTMGEASASQLRIWSHGLPSLVTPVGWYADLPENTVAYVRIGNEIEDIHYHLQHYIENPNNYHAIGKNGQSWLIENHQPEECATAMLKFITEVCQASLYPTARYLIEKSVREMQDYFKSDTYSLDLQRLAQVIYFFR
jgi:glycosyltransferase involved in cell wall biosynthesis